MDGDLSANYIGLVGLEEWKILDIRQLDQVLKSNIRPINFESCSEAPFFEKIRFSKADDSTFCVLTRSNDIRVWNIEANAPTTVRNFGDIQIADFTWHPNQNTRLGPICLIAHAKCLALALHYAFTKEYTFRIFQIYTKWIRANCLILSQ
jgi:hypothetical protein